MRGKKRIRFAVFVLAFMIMFMTFSSHGDMTISEVKQGVIRIVVENARSSGTGSGFAIGIQGEPVEYIITNYHVIRDMTEIYLYLDEDNVYPMDVTDIVFEENDMALLKLRKPVDFLQPLIIETQRRGEAGEDVYALGFPGLSDALSKNFTGYPEDITVTKGVISRITIDTHDNEFYQIDAVISGGNSGGPLISTQGYVLGINSFGMTNDDGSPMGYNGSLIMDKLIEKLEEEGIPFTSTADIVVETISTDEEDKDEDNDEDKDEDKDEDDDRVSRNDNSDLVMISSISIGAILLVAIITIIAVAASGRKKRNAKSDETTPVVVTVPVKEEEVRKPQIFGISGYQAGKVFDIEGIMTFGRNPASKISYPTDYKGISGNHCLLQYDEQNDLYILSDMGSSYGTFLENGQMIQKNSKVALNKGDKFYLADPQELFEVR